MRFFKTLLEKIRENKILLSAFLLLYFLIFTVATEIFLNQINTVITPSVYLFTVIFALSVIFISLMLFGLTGNVFVSGFIPTFVILVFYVVNFYRVYISGHALSPADFALAKQLGNILSFTTISLEKRVAASIGLMICDWIMLFLLSKPIKTGLRERMLVFSGGLMLTLTLFYLSAPLFSYNSTASPASFYKKHGAAMGFFYILTANAVDTIIIEGADMTELLGSDYIKNWTPKPYSKETMENLVAIIKENSQRTEMIGVEKPNIIVIMSEAFIDPTVIENLNFSDDPLPNFHGLQALNSTISGNVITPAFGGGTCDPEFEFLTGNLLINTGAGRSPYLDHDYYIRENEEKSIARILSRQGYKTVGVHPYLGDFYDRISIYKKLGFDEFITSEDMADAPIKGKFISDDYFSDALINEIEKADKPLFLYGISMENHFEYYYNKFTEEPDIAVWSDYLDEELLGGATALVQGLHDADKALGKLVNYLAESEKPTLLFFFGDHLPLVGGSALSFYQDLQYVKSPGFEAMDESEMYKMFTTPYLMWANYDMPKNEYKDMSTAFIGPILLEQAGLEKSLYQQFMYDAYDFFHGAKANLFVDSENEIYLEPTPEMSLVLQMQKLLQYDYLDGEGFVNDAQTAIVK